MRRGLIGIVGVMLTAFSFPAQLRAGEVWVPGVDDLGLQARAHLDCMLAHPSREGPESCGLPPYSEPCEDAACLWRHLQGWRALIARFGETAPADLRARLAENPAVPTYLTATPFEPPAETLADLDRDCGHTAVGADMLEACLFDAANTASEWLDLYQWYSGTDPRLRAGED